MVDVRLFELRDTLVWRFYRRIACTSSFEMGNFSGSCQVMEQERLTKRVIIGPFSIS